MVLACGSGRGGQGERGQERGLELVGPGPGLRYPDLASASALAADQPGGGVQDPVPQGLGLGLGQGPVQAQQPQPGQQVRGEGRGHTPGRVDRQGVGGYLKSFIECPRRA